MSIHYMLLGDKLLMKLWHFIYEDNNWTEILRCVETLQILTVCVLCVCTGSKCFYVINQGYVTLLASQGHIKCHSAMHLIGQCYKILITFIKSQIWAI